jgi:hypothetical protein
MGKDNKWKERAKAARSLLLSPKVIENSTDCWRECRKGFLLPAASSEFSQL